MSLINMKLFLSIFIALFFTANLAMSQDTLYVYQGGAVLYQRAVASVDSVGFTYIKPESGTLIDNDGHSYKYKQFGTQVWMTENLRTSKYSNGENITNTTLATDWIHSYSGAWCDYNNDVANDSKYGKLYNWYAVSDSRKIAPTGWHVATDAEWTILTNYVAANFGTSLSTAKALAATNIWASYGTTGTIGNNHSINNFSGFNAIPRGLRSDADGSFFNFGFQGYWWCNTNAPGTYNESYFRDLLYNNSGVGSYFLPMSNGFSVRCVRD